MKKILFVGESPLGCTGNGNFMRALINQVDNEKYQIVCYVVGTNRLLRHDIFSRKNFNIIPADGAQDKWNGAKLLHLIKENPIDAVVFVGIDVWVYAPIFHEIQNMKVSRGFKMIGIHPYDSPFPRKDWIGWFDMLDVPCVYSEFGYNLVKEHLPRVKYFRPPLFAHEIFHNIKDKKSEFRHKYFPTIGDGFLFGFVGNNQVRKDPQKAILAYSMVKKKYPDSYLYMHLNTSAGVYNLVQCALDAGLKSGDLIAKSGDPDSWVSLPQMVEIYNCFDALLNCSLQEGLSWTLVEAMLCGIPVIATDTTAQTELVKNTGVLVPCEDLTYMPVFTEKGQSWIWAKSCNADDLAKAMEQIITDEKLRERCVTRGYDKAEKWLEGVSNINDLLDETFEQPDQTITPRLPTGVKDEIVFAQHSSAGDVLMTTKCFKGIREIYDDRPLTFMTQRHYMDIVEGNPNLKEVIPWDEQEFNTFRFRLNPHQERILPGHWGRNCNSILSDFYWKILMVNPEPIYVAKVTPPEDVLKELTFSKFQQDKKVCIVHTTGGDPAFRTYKYMGEVCKELRDKYTTIQVGGKTDFDAFAEIDLRGRLTWRQTAWLMDVAEISINVDSFVSHLAGAFGVSQIVLFGSGNAVVVRPDQVKGDLICMVPDYVMDCPGLGPCSGSIRTCPHPCTGVHDPQEILKNVEVLEQSPCKDAVPGTFVFRYQRRRYV